MGSPGNNNNNNNNNGSEGSADDEGTCESFEVECILDHHDEKQSGRRRPRRAYLIKWLGYDDPLDNTWLHLPDLGGCLKMVEAYNRRVRVKGLDADDLGRKVRELETEKIAEMREEQRAQDEAEGMDGDEDEDEEEKDAETLEAELAALEKRTAELLAKHQAAWQPQPVAPVPAPAPAKKKEDKESAAKKSQKNKRNAAIVDKVVSAAAASKKKKLAAAAIDKEVTLSKSKLATAAIDKEVTPSKGKLTAAAIDKEITPSKSKLAAATIDKAITTPKGKSSAVPAAAVNSNASTVKPRVKHGSTLLTSTIRLPTIKKQKVSESAAKTTASAKSNDHASVYATPAQKKNHWDAVDDVKDAPAAGQKKNHWDAVDEEKTAPVAASRTKKHWEMDVDTETSVEPVANERRLSNNWFSGGNSTTTIASSGTSTDSIKKPASLLSAFSGQALPFGSALAPKPPSPTKEQQTRAMFFPAIKPRVMKPVRQPIPINTEERRQETEDELIQMLGLSGSTSILRRPMMLDRMDEDPVQTRDEGGASADSARKAVQDQTADLNWGAGGDDNWMAVDTPAQPEQVVAPAAVADEPVQKPVMDATSPVKRHWDWSPAKDTPTDPVEVKPEIENRVAKEDVNHVQSRNDDDVLPKARFSPLRPSTHIQLNAQVDHVSVVHADPRHRSRDETLPDTASMSSTSYTPRLEREPVPSVDPQIHTPICQSDVLLKDTRCVVFGPYKAFDTVALVSKLKNQGASVRDKVTPDRATVLIHRSWIRWLPMLPGLRSLKRTECMFLQYGTDKEADASVAPFYGELYPQGGIVTFTHDFAKDNSDDAAILVALMIAMTDDPWKDQGWTVCLHSSDHDAISADPELAAAIIEPLTEHNLLRKIETELEVPSECGSHDRVVVSSMERLLQAEMFHIRHALFIADDAVADHLLKSGAAGAGVEVFTKDQFIREFVPGCGDGDEEE